MMHEPSGLRDIATDEGFARLRAVVGLLAIAAIVVTVVILLNVTKAGPTSYRNGYSVGESIGGTFGATNARDDCLYVGSIPHGDNPNRWVSGCIAGWDHASNNDNHSATTG